MSLQAIKFDRQKTRLDILDQLLIPYQTKYIQVSNIDDGYSVIQKMQVRGAPAIAIVGSFSITCELNSVKDGQKNNHGYDVSNLSVFKAALEKRIDYLIKSRPTAVNLVNACTAIKAIVETACTIDDLYAEVLRYSVVLFEDDLKNNYRIGANGVRYIDNELSNFEGPFAVMTICNTGSLATSGHGTALGIIRSLWAESKANPRNNDDKTIQGQKSWLSHVYACETRPYNQGSRLTSYELNFEKIPFSLITDNMPAYLVDSLFSQRVNCPLPSRAPVKFIIVGADRIVANGDLANKIGTFQLALIASQYDGVKFIGAAPTTTIDYTRDSGDDIVIEQRPANELTSILGGQVDSSDQFVTDSEGKINLLRIKTATPNIDVWNPAFDVTPNRLIDSIVTEQDYLVKDSHGKFNL
ncbi:S-methyl-5-thioribose-1-phosphate isomerase [Komagataella kurtzmanii]|nr:S-methyl-5-thioribose-1-phosphate isomerase [Komagataella kurtzmanii]